MNKYYKILSKNFKQVLAGIPDTQYGIGEITQSSNPAHPIYFSDSIPAMVNWFYELFCRTSDIICEIEPIGKTIKSRDYYGGCQYASAKVKVIREIPKEEIAKEHINCLRKPNAEFRLGCFRYLPEIAKGVFENIQLSKVGWGRDVGIEFGNITNIQPGALAGLSIDGNLQFYCGERSPDGCTSAINDTYFHRFKMNKFSKGMFGGVAIKKNISLGCSDHRISLSSYRENDREEIILLDNSEPQPFVIEPGAFEGATIGGKLQCYRWDDDDDNALSIKYVNDNGVKVCQNSQGELYFADYITQQRINGSR